MTHSLYDSFTEPLLEWFERYGRKNLPWQTPRSPYKVWISEVMLQQTQVKTVIPYFTRFMNRFPDVFSLAQAPEDELLSYWSGLGYYSRARHLHKTAQIIVYEFKGAFPKETSLLCKLPGIGESTAAAIASLAFNQPTAILDGNVKRVLSRYFMIAGAPNTSATKKILWEKARLCMAKDQCSEYTQAIMDLGAICCTLKQPSCSTCPLKLTCQAWKANQVSNFPQKTPKKSKPIKHQWFMLLSNEREIYLEKRPAKGIWGGLWSLPSIDITMNPAEHLKNEYGLESHVQKQLLTIKHTFSHYHLHIHAISVKINSSFKSRLSHGQWFSYDKMKQLGIAKPVTDIINYFFRSS